MSRAPLLAWILALGTLAGSTGCRAREKEPDLPPSVAPAGLKVVAILPFASEEAGQEAVATEFAEIFASEWVKVAGTRAVRPRALPDALERGGKVRNVEDALRLARGAKADAFVTASVTDYDPYEPPRIGVSVQFFRVDARPISDAEVDRLVQSASWRCGPLTAGRDKAGNWIASFERLYDAHDRRVRERLASYARSQEGGDTAFDREREFLAVQPRYLQFVSNQVITEILQSCRADGP